MGTRCVVSFEQKGNPTFHIYKHFDGYPENIIPLIADALGISWILPRYENDEFSASFVATTKAGCGGIRLTTGPSAHGDLEFVYKVKQSSDQKLRVTAYEIDWGDRLNKIKVAAINSKKEIVYE